MTPDNTRRIVSSYAGRGTGETIHVDDHGTHWRDVPLGTASNYDATGVTFGSRSGSTITPTRSPRK